MLMERHTMRYHEFDHSVNKGHIWSQCPEKVALVCYIVHRYHCATTPNATASDPVTAEMPPPEIVMSSDDVSMGTSPVSKRSHVDISVSILRL
ncbi:hypothetical protein G6F57_010198 [Rhizopus arrhizus]|nr:hypothetical protein G6F23_006018 [Rhizopus arrhizus]KAG1252901.1 hypothetical protein G6F68_011576 [Rhizopus microsporus]KAG1424126.1 hypothetical protein G6F58_002524 [Rhizopus delemar]KAG0765731.1 hypothetical protein G6F24_004180 [Rhizopus arrhizus]KAG0789950.1 hypothetical protein G6F21_006154 [Rhizopus arrhizus]